VNKTTFDLSTLRLSLSGALLGVAVMGLLSNWVHQVPYHDAVGAVLGGVSVLFAKARHLF